MKAATIAFAALVLAGPTLGQGAPNDRWAEPDVHARLECAPLHPFGHEQCADCQGR